MPRYRNALPQLAGGLFLTDGGLETTLVFHEGNRINCAHPTHFVQALRGGPWTQRIRAVRANASTKSHAELNESTELDAGDPQELAARYLDLAGSLENLNVLGGCCGTDERHVAEIRKFIRSI